MGKEEYTVLSPISPEIIITFTSWMHILPAQFLIIFCFPTSTSNNAIEKVFQMTRIVILQQ